MVPTSTSIGYCIYLESLNLGRNTLTGNIPSELKHAKSLVYLQLHENNLNGTLPHFVSKFEQLIVLNLANNHFRGSVTILFGWRHRIRILSLRSNNFNGSLPEEIYPFNQLQILDLSQNNFTGMIPRHIGNLRPLLSRDDNVFSLDDISGFIDMRLQMVIKGIMIQFEKLYNYNSAIDLSCNFLEGNIPKEIGLLQGLSSLNLSHNRFSGIIPKSVGNMSSLESLDLSFNKLSGHIPQSLASLDFLGYLNLSYNNLIGRIPIGLHLDTLSGDGSAYANNSLLCGFSVNKTCADDQKSNATDADGNFPSEGYEDDKENVKDKLLLYAIVALGFGFGFWGLFFVLICKKEKWWFRYWRLVDLVAVRVANCMVY
ncbi:hypothetical protein MKW92_005723 [Papaver armeniacum]|nr:hypothetical protein MKW92_005723 [Papaver armeniacum]